MERFDQREQDAVANVIRSGELSRFFANFGGGKNVQDFEKEFAEYLGSNFAVSVSNGTVALEVALAALGLKPGDEVITTSLTFIATATAILRNGLKPVFVDIDPETLNMDELLVEDAITRQTKAIISVSLLGKPARMDILSDVAKDNKLWLLEDAAQSLGARSSWVGCNQLRGTRKIGTCGDISTFSFQESKTISTLGEGGAIVTDNDKLADLCKHQRNHGNIYGTLEMDQPCTNARLTEAAAAFGRVQLTKLDEFIKTQRLNALTLFETIEPPFIPVYTEMDSTYYIIPYVLGMPNSVSTTERLRIRDRLIEKFKEAGISQGVPGANIGYYKKLVYDNPIFAKYKPKNGCPNAEWARDNILLFDIHRWSRTPEDMVKIAEQINKIIKEPMELPI